MSMTTMDTNSSPAVSEGGGGREVLVFWLIFQLVYKSGSD